MSYDLGVWFQPTPITLDRANEIYGALCEMDAEGLPTSPAVAAFFEELLARYPSLESLSDDEVDDSPWSITPTLDEEAGLVLCLRFSMAADVAGWVAERAHAHGLVVYDPQTPRLHWPPGS